MSTDAVRLREAIYNRLLQRSGYKQIMRVYVPSIQPDNIPSIAGYIISETETPDGDGNAGELSFTNNITIGVSIVRGFDDPEFLDGRMDIDLENIRTDLLRDPTFVTFGKTDSLDGDASNTDVLFESVAQISSRRLYPKGGATYFAEARLEFTFVKRCDLKPIVPDDYRGMTITTRQLGEGAGTPAIALHVDEDS